ncbi:hypothetical protein K7X08_000416 [Anisodus acutangulus]|uniref:pyruvate decarboxylase n=1 Tax=Anisodus acutangulus TaxID=402998 RepID=A0A9Q1M3R3_9SOLA|nr:hypothetical protein K7X08_000416 [Anisodus acutangulus]
MLQVLHHNIGLKDFSPELRCFQTVTSYQAVVNNLEDAHELIDTAISTSLMRVNRYELTSYLDLSNMMGLEAAVEFLNKAVKPVLVGWQKIRFAKACDALAELADGCGYAVAVMPSAKGAVIAETGDSWFNCQKLKLPQGCGYEFQMQYESIGWSVGATLGYAQAAPEKRVIACIGNGSFQVTAQDISTMLRCGQRTIIFLINNGGYTIEVEIHDGPYNVIKNWNYTGSMQSTTEKENVGQLRLIVKRSWWKQLKQQMEPRKTLFH